MPRNLPWLTGGAAKKEATTPRQSRKRASSSSSDIVDSNLDAVSKLNSPQRKSTKPCRREASSSPVCAPPKEDVTYMKEGFNADDIYMMVEDEFDHTAHLFTQHIHAAEYERLKRLHKSRGAETLANIQRATDGKTAPRAELRIRLEQQERARQRKEARKGFEDSESGEEDDPYMQDPQLAGLMMGSQQSGPGRELKGFAKAKTHTRATAGYLQSPYKSDKHRDVLAEEGGRRRMPSVSPSEDEYDEDLGEDVVQISSPSIRVKQKPLAQEVQRSAAKPTDVKPQTTGGSFRPFAQAKRGETDVRAVLSSTDKRSEPKRELATMPIPSQSQGGKGSRFAQMLAQRNQMSGAQSEDWTSRSVESESKIEVTHKSPSPSPSRPTVVDTKYNANEKRSENVSALLSRQKEIKLEDKARMHRNLDEIPTFLF